MPGQIDRAPVRKPFGSGREGLYFLFLRWTRVRFRSLRCFFFRIRLRRFLINDPMKPRRLTESSDRDTRRATDFTDRNTGDVRPVESSSLHSTQPAVVACGLCGLGPPVGCGPGARVFRRLWPSLCVGWGRRLGVGRVFRRRVDGPQIWVRSAKERYREVGSTGRTIGPSHPIAGSSTGRTPDFESGGCRFEPCPASNPSRRPQPIARPPAAPSPGRRWFEIGQSRRGPLNNRFAGSMEFYLPRYREDRPPPPWMCRSSLVLAGANICGRLRVQELFA